MTLVARNLTLPALSKIRKFKRGIESLFRKQCRLPSMNKEGRWCTCWKRGEISRERKWKSDFSLRLCTCVQLHPGGSRRRKRAGWWCHVKKQHARPRLQVLRVGLNVTKPACGGRYITTDNYGRGSSELPLNKTYPMNTTVATTYATGLPSDFNTWIFWELRRGCEYTPGVEVTRFRVPIYFSYTIKLAILTQF